MKLFNSVAGKFFEVSCCQLNHCLLFIIIFVYYLCIVILYEVEILYIKLKTKPTLSLHSFYLQKYVTSLYCSITPG